jgi:hypothetical protein
MLSYEGREIARASAQISLPHGNPYPAHGDRVPVIKMRRMKVRALSASFYVDGGRVAEEGRTYDIDWPEGKGLVVRGLAVRV